MSLSGVEMPAVVTIQDDSGLFGTQLDLLARDVQLAWKAWTPYLANQTASIEISVTIGSQPALGATGGSRSSTALQVSPMPALFAFGAPFEITTGNDINGDLPDIIINISADSLTRSYWLGAADGGALPWDRSDIVDALIHEIGHGLGINGFRDALGALDKYQSTFDRWVTVVNGQPMFNGPASVAAYGGPVPLVAGNLYHVDPSAPGFANDVMGPHSIPGVHASLSPLDIAMLSDCGVATILSDSILGGPGADTIDGGTGDDTVMAGTGHDSVTGGEGADYLRGEAGNDVVAGGPGSDDINGNQGDDTCRGGDGADWVVGGQDNDVLSGDAGDDIVYGNLGNDTCAGGDGNDLVRGGQGNDSLEGGAGADWISGDRGDDTEAGGAGADVFHSFAGAGVDRVLDFNPDEGDRIQLDAGTVYAVSQVGADTVIELAGGGKMILVGVDMGSLHGTWIFGA